MTQEAERPRQLPSPPRAEQGGRVELRAATLAPSDECLYDGRFFIGEASFVGRFLVRKSPSLSVTVVEVDEHLPAWLLDFTTTLLRTTARSAKDGFPRRLTRWRAGELTKE